jgi:hypothetical protein
MERTHVRCYEVHGVGNGQPQKNTKNAEKNPLIGFHVEGAALLVRVDEKVGVGRNHAPRPL